MPDVRDRIRHSRPAADSLAPIDLDHLARRARRQELGSRSAAALVVAVVVAGGVLAADALRTPDQLSIGPGDVAGQPDDATTAPGEDDGRDQGTDGSQEGSPAPATLGEAIDHLIDANHSAPPRPEPSGDEILVERTYAIWGESTVQGDGNWTTQLAATWYEQRIHADGTVEVIRAPLGVIEPSGDLAAMRAQAAPYFEAGPPEAEPFDESDFAIKDAIAAALDEAERESHGSAEPQPGTTERPDQAHAFMQAADVLRMGLQPQDRIRALEIIARLDASLVEYRGVARDLLGREGIAIAGRDVNGGEAVDWNVLIFDPQTGDLLGEYDELVAPGAAPTITGYTARETILLDTTE